MRLFWNADQGAGEMRDRSVGQHPMRTRLSLWALAAGIEAIPREIRGSCPAPDWVVSSGHTLGPKNRSQTYLGDTSEGRWPNMIDTGSTRIARGTKVESRLRAEEVRLKMRDAACGRPADHEVSSQHRTAQRNIPQTSIHHQPGEALRSHQLTASSNSSGIEN
ncbi:hypothetical protein BDV12DRAFT_147269 [Aspergillus spectabilis]